MNKIWLLNGHGSTEVWLRLELCLLVLVGAVTAASEAARTGIFGCLWQGSHGQNRFDLGISMRSLILGTVPATSCCTGFAPDQATGLAFPAGDANAHKGLQKACSPNAKMQDAKARGSLSHYSPQDAKLHERWQLVWSYASQLCDRICPRPSC